MIEASSRRALDFIAQLTDPGAMATVASRWRKLERTCSAMSARARSARPISSARADALAKGTVINGLAVLCRDAGCSGRPMAYDLEAAFARDIIGGPGSFVVTADSPASFEDAVRRKLILEISAAPPADTRLAVHAAGP